MTDPADVEKGILLALNHGPHTCAQLANRHGWSHVETQIHLFYMVDNGSIRFIKCADGSEVYQAAAGRPKAPKTKKGAS
jgi:hypothetical protein